MAGCPCNSADIYAIYAMLDIYAMFHHWQLERLELMDRNNITAVHASAVALMKTSDFTSGLL